MFSFTQIFIRSGYTDIPLSSIRSVIAQRLTASKQTSPHGHATAASDIGAIIRYETRDVSLMILMMRFHFSK